MIRLFHLPVGRRIEEEGKMELPMMTNKIEQIKIKIIETKHDQSWFFGH